MAKQPGKGRVPPATQKTNAERRHELELAKLEYKKSLRIADNRYKLWRQLIVAAMVGGVAYCMYLSVDSLAGKSTKIDTFIEALADIKIDQWIYMAIAGVCGGGWFMSARLRRTTIKDLGAHTRELESELAPERKSSGLLPDGRAKQEDKDDA